MVVQTREKHLGHFGAIGLLIGEVNVKEYFPRGVAMVELELDHLRIACPLEPSFWQDRPEIHDFRLSSWLESKRNSGKLAAPSAPVALIPSGQYSFRLQILSKDESDHALTAPPPTAYFTPTIPVAALLDRRKHNTRRVPERRKVARIKGDESPSPAASH
jgi:hypothetical protein